MLMRIHLNRSICRGCWEVFVYDESSGFDLPWRITVEQLPAIREGERMDPSVEFPYEMSSSIISALKDALAEAGFLQETGPLEGELKATKVHLEDMRKLTFASMQK
jgi:hypothetical protein